MGDMADMQLQDMMNDPELLWKFGGIAKSVFACKRCGMKGLVWKNFFGEWLPAEPHGKKHKCEQPSAAQAFK